MKKSHRDSESAVWTHQANEAKPDTSGQAQSEKGRFENFVGNFVENFIGNKISTFSFQLSTRPDQLPSRAKKDALIEASIRQFRAISTFSFQLSAFSFQLSTQRMLGTALVPASAPWHLRFRRAKASSNATPGLPGHLQT